MGHLYPQHAPIGTHWLAIAGKTDGPFLHNLQASANTGRGQFVTVQFDVSAIADNQRITGISESSYLNQSGFRPLSFPTPDAAYYYLKTSATDVITTLASLSIDESTPMHDYAQQSDTKSFGPKQGIHVTANLWMQDGVGIDTFLLDFNVVTVPEPASVLLALFGLLAIAGHRRPPK